MSKSIPEEHRALSAGATQSPERALVECWRDISTLARTETLQEDEETQALADELERQVKRR